MPPVNGTFSHLRHQVSALAGTALLAHVLLLLPLPVAWRGSAALLILMLPGIVLALAVFDAEGDWLVLSFLGICGGIALSTLLLLALHAIPGPLLWWMVLLSCDLLSLLIGWRLLRQPLRPSVTLGAGRTHAYLPLAAVVLLGALLRLTLLGSAEFQGDESHAVLMAVDALLGRDEILFLHEKGPVEVLAPAGPMALLGQASEWTSRLPFAVAGIAILLGSYVLARALLDEETNASAVAGLLSAAILALDGFLIAFSRIVQYQSILILMMLGAVWCAWRFYQGNAQPRRYLVCAAVFVAVGLLSHYDGVFVLPALAWLVLAGGWRRRWRISQWARELAVPALVGAGLLASFYVPFALNEHFAATMVYLAGRTNPHGPGLALFNNLGDYYVRATFYNTTFQIHALAIALAGGFLAWLRKYMRPRALGWALALLLLAGCAILVWAPKRFASDAIGNWAIVAFGVPIAGLILSPATPARLRLLALWFGAPFIAMAFLIGRPVTHFYPMDAPAAMLVGLTIVRLVQWLRARKLHWAVAPLALSGAALAALAIPYMYMVFVRQAPEYSRVFPAARPAIYRASYGDKLPTVDGYFGFPHRSGWKVIGDLYQRGLLRGSYSSNEEDQITLWYTRTAVPCSRTPTYYFVATTPNDPQRIPMQTIEESYHLLGSVQIDGAKTLDIYSREPSGRPVQVFSLSESIDAFDRYPLLRFASQPTRFALASREIAQTSLAGRLRLEQNGLDYKRLAVGETATLWFNWRSLAPLGPDDRLSLDVLDGQGRVVMSGERLCDRESLANRATGQRVRTSFALTASDNVPPGVYTVAVRLHTSQSDRSQAPATDAGTLAVATLTVVDR